jgi:hypothetical protein
MKCIVWLLLGLLSIGCAAAGHSDEPIRVLLLGDSISIGYTPYVREYLGDRAVVVRPMNRNGKGMQNCAGTNNGIEKVGEWIALDGGDWDVIHFNFGLHDFKRVHQDTGRNSNDPGDPQQAPPGRYEQQLRRITAALDGTGARLVFATTTPVPEGVRPYRAPSDPVEYNQIALSIMEEYDVAIDDLYALALLQLERIQNPRDVHFNRAGSELLGRQVANSILKVAGLAADD